ncbi:hypothetical protein SADUNF_Sadunf12G0014000 [Salix dunnii]|uniref:TF-B3 domain-containing protein n=1 Tax=Salix dunnii TaxID=1413687 RepID=A0A835JHY4_9ROSI|nr:hypothetical protein SADUNF_Sadunf12G0014000 [Salix dunnii]
MATFSKVLRPTDIYKRLSVPAKYLKSLPSFEGGYAVVFQAVDDDGHVWTFKCSVRKKGRYPKPVLGKGWLAFVASKNLKVGDKVTFFEEKNKSAATHVYRVQVAKEVRVFGAVFGYALIVAP